jgi:hypothetical protein
MRGQKRVETRVNALMTRASIEKVFAKKMDRRVKPGGDDFIFLPSCEWPRHTWRGAASPKRAA